MIKWFMELGPQILGGVNATFGDKFEAVIQEAGDMQDADSFLVHQHFMKQFVDSNKITKEFKTWRK